MTVVQLPDQDIATTAGCGARFTVALTDFDGAAVDGTGFTAIYVAVVYATGAEQIRLDMSNGLSWDEDGKLVVEISDEDMAGLSGNLHHEVKVWDALGNPSHAMRGANIVRQSFA